MVALDLTGQQYGELTVIEYAGNYKWVCKCSCGNTKTVRGGDLVAGKTKSCGCLKKRLLSQKKLIDLTGMVFGRLTVLSISQRKPDIIWKCKCECGNIVDVKGEYLRNGDTKSCGCLKTDKLHQRNLKHGLSRKSRLYNVWKGMRERCNNQNSESYARYGGRGITVCDEWNDYYAFYKWSMNHGFDESLPASYCTIDRIDNNAGYSPDNCRWTTQKEQARNRSTNHLLTMDGDSKTIVEWSESTGIPERIIANRVNVCGWDEISALTIGVGKKNGT